MFTKKVEMPNVSLSTLSVFRSFMDTFEDLMRMSGAAALIRDPRSGSVPEALQKHLDAEWQRVMRANNEHMNRVIAIVLSPGFSKDIHTRHLYLVCKEGADLLTDEKVVNDANEFDRMYTLTNGRIYTAVLAIRYLYDVTDTTP